jgi:hypothetical protein
LESFTGQDWFLLIRLSDKMIVAQTPLTNPLLYAPAFEAADPLRPVWADPVPAFVASVFRLSAM